MQIASMPATTVEVSPSPEQVLYPPRPAQAHRIASDEEALKIARQLSRQFSVDAAKRDRERNWRNARTHTLHDPVRWKPFIIGNFVLNETLPPRHGAI